MTRTIPLLACTSLLLFAAPSLVAQSVPTPGLSGNGPPSSLDPTVLAPYFDVDRLSVQELDPIEIPDSAEILVEVELDGAGVTLSLFPHSLRHDGFEVLVDDGSGPVRVPAPPVRTRKGTVLEIPGSTVRASTDGTSVTAWIHTPRGTYAVQPVAEVGFLGAPTWHVVHSAEVILPSPFTCATKDPVGGGTGTFGGPLSLGTTLSLTEIGVDADFEFYQQNSSSVASTVNDIENVINGVEGTYDVTGILIGYELTTVVVRTGAADPYGSQSNPGGLLSAFDNNWSTSPENAIPRDVAHLFTGVNLDGSVIGIANLADICTNNAYGLSQSRFSSNFNSRLALTAHELGHNWAATHCNGQTSCRIMCSGLGGCNGLNPLSFGPSATGQIINYRDTRGCLSTRPPALALPFLDEFPSGGLDSTKWIFSDGAVVTTAGVGEPSSPNSLSLDATGSGEFEDDQVRTAEILLGGTVNPSLQYFVQHRGVESGEELVVEYLNVSLDWTEIDRITSNGTDQTSYVQRNFSLPGNARHNRFRLRFRTEVNSPTDDWYIDNVSITEGPPPPLDPPQIASVTPSSGPTAGGTFLTILGQDFGADVVFLIDGQLLVDPIYISQSEVRGYTPQSPTPGTATVIASQGSGSDILDPGFIYTQEDLIHGDGNGAPGSIVDTPVLADHETTLSGYSIAVDFDASQIEAVEIIEFGTEAEGADFFTPTIDNGTGPDEGWWTLGVVLSFTGANTVAPAAESVLAIARYFVPPTATLNDVYTITPVTGVGFPPTDNLFVDTLGTALTPSLFGGIVTVSGSTFIRGDANSDDVVNIGDAIAVLGYLFSSGPATCLDALDGNDDGSLNIADAISLLDFLFAGGPPPPAPFPGAGIDPTADSIDCDP